MGHHELTTLVSSFGSWSVLTMIGTVIVHLAFSASVYNDANTFKNENGNTVLVGPIIWSLSVLIGGVFVALTYWVIHHSAISK